MFKGEQATVATAARQPTVLAEGSLLGRLVALLSPIFVIAAGWIADVVANAVLGAQIDQTRRGAK